MQVHEVGAQVIQNGIHMSEKISGVWQKRNTSACWPFFAFVIFNFMKWFFNLTLE